VRDNKHYGDDITHKDPNTLRIYFQNVAGVSPADDWSNHIDNFVQMKKKQIDIFGFAKTNVSWTPTAQNESRRHGKGIFKYYKQVTASSDDPTVGYRQPDTKSKSQETMGRRPSPDYQRMGDARCSGAFNARRQLSINRC
jgi:hypothetical protein